MRWRPGPNRPGLEAFVIQITSWALAPRGACVANLAQTRDTSSGHGGGIAPPPIDPIFDTAIVRLSSEGLGVGEIVRRLQPIGAAIGKPVPSYSTALRVARDSQSRARRPNPYLEEIVEKLATGRMPNLYRADDRAIWLEHEAACDLDHKQL